MKLEVPRTEGIKYAGSKLYLLPYILNLVRKVNPSSVFDGFSGTTRVSQALARLGYTVIANDIAVWSEVFATCYLLNRKPPSAYRELIEHLDNLPGKDGWFTEIYGGEENGGLAIQKDGLKRPWQIHNTRRLDAIREEIERLSLSKVEKAVALTSLILALDEVDNTLGHYASYLRYWSPRSYKKLRLRVPALWENHQEHRVIRGNIFDLLKEVSCDLAYFDPPYGSDNNKMPPSRVRYASYYHLWTTVCLYDKPEVFGRARRRIDTKDNGATSVFEDFRRDGEGRFRVLNALRTLLEQVRARWVILSYSSAGRITPQEVYELMSPLGQVTEILKIHYKRHVMSSMSWTKEWSKEKNTPHQEFLFLLQKK